MFNFKKKKSGTEEPLSEEQIQLKLYGDFEPKGSEEIKIKTIEDPIATMPPVQSQSVSPTLESQSASPTREAQSASSARPQKVASNAQTQNISPSIKPEEKKPETQTLDLFNTATPVPASEPEVKAPIEDSFSAPVSTSPTSNPPSTKTPTPEPKKVPSTQGGVSIGAGTATVEEPTFDQTAPSVPKTREESHLVKQIHLSEPSELPEPAPDASQKWRDFFQAISYTALKALSFFDFRRTYVRRLFMILGGIGALILILVGVHSLNVNREQAMPVVSSPISERSVATTATKALSSTSEKPAQPAQATINREVVKETTKTTEEPTAQRSLSLISLPTAAEQPLSAPAPEAVESTSSESTPAPAEVAPSAPLDQYVLQVATYVTEADAVSLQNELQSNGFDSFVRDLSRSGGRVYYDVFIGRFATFKDAQKGMQDFKASPASKPFGDAFVRRLS